MRGARLVPRAAAVLLLAALLAGCAPTLAPLNPDARAVWAFDVETYLGRRFSGYGTTLADCASRRQTELALQQATRDTNPERFPFYRTTVLSRCYPAALTDGGYAWGVEAGQVWGAVMPSAGLCDAMRDSFAASVPPEALTPCVPVTLTPRGP